MALVTKEFKLDLAPGQLRPVVNASQGDIGRPFKADLYWNGSPWTATGYTAKLRGKKPDNTVFEYTATVSGSSVTFSTTEQMTIIGGMVECELVFSQSGDVIASANFLLIVEASPYDPANPSESVIPGIEDIVTDVVDDVVGDNVGDWLDEHPEATTTVQDGAITKAKINTAFLPEIENAYVTPEMFGAKGDGTTDDTQALQSAVNSEKPVFLSEKTYKITSPLNVATENTTIYGSGFGSVIKSTGTGDVINLTAWKPTFENFSINGSDTATTGIKYARSVSASLGVLNHVFISNVTGWAIDQGENALYALNYNDVIIRECGHGLQTNSKDSFYSNIDIDKTDGYGVRVTANSTSNLFSNMKIAECAMDDRTKAGLAIVGHRNTFNNLHLQDNGGNGLYLYGSYNVIDGIILDANSANTLYPATDSGDGLYCGAVILGDHNTVKSGNAQNYRGGYQKVAYICRPNTKNVIDIQLNGQAAIGCSYSEEMEYTPRKFADIKTTLATNSGSMTFDSTTGYLKPNHNDYFSLPFGSCSMRFVVKSEAGIAKIVTVGNYNVRVGDGKIAIYNVNSVATQKAFDNTSSFETVTIDIYPEQRATGIAYVLSATGGGNTVYQDVTETPIDVFRGAGQANIVSSFLISKQDSAKVDKNTIAYVTASNSTAQTNCIDSVSGRGLTVTSNAVSIVDLW